jgi:predicted GNAT family N-acyltransferase
MKVIDPLSPPSKDIMTTPTPHTYTFKFSDDLTSTVHKDSVNLRTEVFVREQNVPVELEVDADESRCLYIVAYSEEGIPAATLRLMPEDAGLHVQRVCVARQFRGTGLGRLLMQQAHEYARQHAIHELHLDAQVHATGFYERLGYSLTERPEFLDAGIAHRQMTLHLIP